MADEPEELKLLKEALWYIQWSMVFDIASLVVAIVGLVPVRQGRQSAVLILAVLFVLIRLISRYLYAKFRQYRRRADEVNDD
jgi:hypothetical protein